jgi:hypothetical protein
MRDKKSHFVLLCQQALTCGVVLAVAAPATAVVTLDIVAPTPAGPRPAAVTSVPVTGR